MEPNIILLQKSALPGIANNQWEVFAVCRSYDLMDGNYNARFPFEDEKTAPKKKIITLIIICFFHLKTTTTLPVVSGNLSMISKRINIYVERIPVSLKIYELIKKHNQVHFSHLV